MKNLSILLSLFVLLSFKGIGQTHSFISDQIKCTYETQDGRMNGSYVSYYKNGQKKAEGKFENNYRIGKWTVYDSIGRIRIQREYSDPFDYAQTIFLNSSVTPKEVTSVYKSNLSYNADGYIDYFELKEEMVVWSKRIWRYITPPENKILFENNNLYNLLFKNISSGQIQAYTDNNFSKKDSRKFDVTVYRVIGYKIEEENVFDNVRSLLETRILGLSPVVINIQTKDTLDLCWFYLPEIRKVLAQEKINQSNSTHIKSLDDLFFYRDFHGQVYKEENVYGRPINSYRTDKTEIAKESESIEIRIIEYEHDTWLDLAKK